MVSNAGTSPRPSDGTSEKYLSEELGVAPPLPLQQIVNQIRFWTGRRQGDIAEDVFVCRETAAQGAGRSVSSGESPATDEDPAKAGDLVRAIACDVLDDDGPGPFDGRVEGHVVLVCPGSIRGHVGNDGLGVADRDGPWQFGDLHLSELLSEEGRSLLQGEAGAERDPGRAALDAEDVMRRPAARGRPSQLCRGHCWWRRPPARHGRRRGPAP